jgi:hypothetical protein
MTIEIRNNSSSFAVCEAVCHRIGHKIIFLSTGGVHLHPDKDYLICRQCGMMLDEIRKESSSHTQPA